MGELTDAEKAEIWEGVRKAFPEDEMMQQIHYVRQVHYLQTKDLPLEERIRFFGGSKQTASA